MRSRGKEGKAAEEMIGTRLREARIDGAEECPADLITRLWGATPEGSSISQAFFKQQSRRQAPTEQ